MLCCMLCNVPQHGTASMSITLLRYTSGSAAALCSAMYLALPRCSALVWQRAQQPLCFALLAATLQRQCVGSAANFESLARHGCLTEKTAGSQVLGPLPDAPAVQADVGQLDRGRGELHGRGQADVRPPLNFALHAADVCVAILDQPSRWVGAGSFVTLRSSQTMSRGSSARRLASTRWTSTPPIRSTTATAR